MLISQHLERYSGAILSLPVDRSLLKKDLLIREFLMAENGGLKMYYAPHNEYINSTAKVMIIGLTPGWTQMKTAMEAARAGLAAELSGEEICKRAKEAASFAGPMRSNLIQMLDLLKLPQALDIPDSAGLFQEQRSLLHTTSVLRYPVFVEQRNYSGTSPGLLNSPFLKEKALRSAAEELTLLPGALVIPLGTVVESVLQQLVQAGELDPGRCLWGFPHPSGANGHRHRQFASRREQMGARMSRFFTNK
ncbi:hypothetical protein C2I18_16470 [Paenibacillus sp. PK3_47]|uniref:uracil-DNA glycosylase family protein n=1 Tax=Paenibacillus sp. PK3_47 TaxID=2072642 RepID=UPI00201DE37B|nr:uracil-DNA glycosylase family protein [Paenibacillus sp. PK3_47]UQZ34975.1 hypothetical protein C2I18_16470 [Paenibacillus sp. PK3_47]